MREDMNEYEEVSLLELISVVLKNKGLIALFLIVGLILGLIVSKIQEVRSPETYRYEAMSTLKLTNGDGMTKQPETLLLVLESRSLIESSMEKLKITDGHYEVRTQESYKPNHFEVIAQGPDKNLTLDLLNEVVSRGQSMAFSSLNMKDNKVIEHGHVIGNPIAESKGVNKLLYVVIFMILGGMISFLYIFSVRVFGGKIHAENDVERILNTSVLAKIPYEAKENGFRRHFKVR